MNIRSTECVSKLVTFKGLVKAGYLKKFIDAYENETTYDYDATLGILTKITDIYGHELDYADSPTADGRIDQITDYTGRVITIDNSTTLSHITLPPASQGESGLTFDLTYYDSEDGPNRDGLLKTVSYDAKLELGGSAVLHEMTITYDDAAKVTKIESTDDSGWEMQSIQSKAVEYVGNATGTQQSPAVQLYASLLLATINPNIGYVQSNLANRADRWGNLSESTDTNGHLTEYDRSPTTTLLGSITVADPDGEGPLGDLVTSLTYDAKGNVTKVSHPVNPNGTRDEINIEYDATYSLPTKITDELGRITKYTVSGGLITSIIQVVGEDDGETLVDDVTVATFTYTDGTGGIPKGMLETSTDSYGVETTYEYYTTSDDESKWGRLKKIIHNSSAAAQDQIEEEFDYDQDGNLSKYTDGRDNETLFEYDRLGRLVRVIEAYPDAMQFTTLDNESTDQDEFDTTGTWSSPISGGNGLNYIEHASGAGSDYAEWTFEGLVPGTTYEVFMTWMPDATYNSDAAPVSVDFGGGSPVAISGGVDQTVDPGGEHPFPSGEWKSLGDFTVVGDTLSVKLTQTDTGKVVADAVRIVASAPKTSFTYNEFADLLQTTDALLSVTEFEYDAMSRIKEILEQDPDGGVANPTTTFNYDSRGNLTAIIDPLLRRTDFAYDDLSRLSTEYAPYPDANPANWPAIDDEDTGYDTPSGNWSEDTSGGQEGDQQRSMDAATATWTFQSTTTGKPVVPGKRYEVVAAWYVAGTEPDTNNAATVQFSFYNGTTAGAQAGQALSDQQYNPTGHTLFGSGWQSLGTLTATGDIITVELARQSGYNGYLLADSVLLVEARAETSYEYDAVGDLTAMTDPYGNTTDYAYDNRLRLSEIVAPDPDGASGQPTTRLLYDGASQLIAAIDPLNRVVRYEYDDFGRIKTVRMSYPDGAAGANTVDNASTGGWTTVSGSGGWDDDYIHFTESGTPSSTSWSTGTLSNDTEYEILATWVPDATTGAPQAPFTIEPSWSSETVVKVDQSREPLDGDAFGEETTNWQSLGHFQTPMSGTNSINVTLDSVFGRKVIADAIRIVEAAPKTTYGYTDTGTNTVTIADALGNATVHEYDEFYRLVTTTLPDPEDNMSSADQPVWEYEYDKADNLVKLIDPFDSETDYAYDALNRLLTVTLPDAGESKYNYRSVHAYAYNAVGQVVRYTDPKDRITSYEYDLLHRLTTVTRPAVSGYSANPETTFAYDAAGQLTDVTEQIDDSNDRTTQYVYDGLGRVIETVLPDPANGNITGSSPVYRTSYDAVGNVLESFDAGGNATGYEYDNLFRLTKAILPDPDGGGDLLSPYTEYAYDLAGQVTSFKSTLTATTSATTTQRTDFVYDRMGRRTEVHLPNPSTGVPAGTPDKHVYAYDAVGNVVSHTNALGRVTDYAYDGLYRLTKRTDPDPDDYDSDPGGSGNGARTRPETEYTYDLVGNVTTLTDPVDNVTTFVYDALHRLDREEITLDSNTKTREYLYDETNKLIEKTDRNGRVTTYDYDALDRLVEELWLDGEENVIQTFEYGYDLVGAFTHAYEDDGPGTSWDSTYDYERDFLSRVESEDYAYKSIATTLDRTFDDDGRVLTLAAMIGTQHDFKNTYEYDPIGRMTEIKQEAKGTGGTYNKVAEKLVELTYRADGRFDTITRYKAVSPGAGDEILESTFGYDKRGRLTSLTHEELVTPSTVADYDFVYNAGDLLESKSENFLGAGAATTTFDYDRTNQLVSVDYPTGPDPTFEYDENGNRDGGGYVPGEVNRVVSDGTNSYRYDDEGNQVARTVLENGEREAMEWDHRNRLTSITTQIPREVAHWRFDGDATNATGDSDLDGTLMNGPTYDDADPVAAGFNQYLVLDGENDYVSLGDDDEFKIRDRDLSVSAWFNPEEDEDRFMTIVDQGNAVNSPGTGYRIAYREDGAGYPRIQVLVNDGSGGPQELVEQYPGGLAGAWHHVLLTIENESCGDINLYVDGVLVESQANTQCGDIQGGVLQVGSQGGVSPGYFERYIDDVRIWHEVLDEDDAEALYLSSDHLYAPSKVVAYDYDAFDRRIEKQIDMDGIGGVDETHAYVYDGADIVLALDGSGNLTNRYLHGPAIDQILADEQYGAVDHDDPTEDEGVVYWPLTDNLGSVRDLVDNAGDVVNHIDYDAFGNITSESDEDVDNIFGFTGRERDEESHLQFNQARYYDAALGRWLSEDPIGFAAGDENLYRYVGNQPTKYTDPIGLAGRAYVSSVENGAVGVVLYYGDVRANDCTELVISLQNTEGIWNDGPDRLIPDPGNWFPVTPLPDFPPLLPPDFPSLVPDEPPSDDSHIQLTPPNDDLRPWQPPTADSGPSILDPYIPNPVPDGIFERPDWWPNIPLPKIDEKDGTVEIPIQLPGGAGTITPRVTPGGFPDFKKDWRDWYEDPRSLPNQIGDIWPGPYTPGVRVEIIIFDGRVKVKGGGFWLPSGGGEFPNIPPDPGVRILEPPGYRDGIIEPPAAGGWFEAEW